jgi:hypothetical protein
LGAVEPQKDRVHHCAALYNMLVRVVPEKSHFSTLFSELRAR